MSDLGDQTIAIANVEGNLELNNQKTRVDIDQISGQGKVVSVLNSGVLNVKRSPGDLDVANNWSNGRVNVDDLSGNFYSTENLGTIQVGVNKGVQRSWGSTETARERTELNLAERKLENFRGRAYVSDNKGPIEIGVSPVGGERGSNGLRDHGTLFVTRQLDEVIQHKNTASHMDIPYRSANIWGTDAKLPIPSTSRTTIFPATGSHLRVNNMGSDSRLNLGANLVGRNGPLRSIGTVGAALSVPGLAGVYLANDIQTVKDVAPAVGAAPPASSASASSSGPAAPETSSGSAAAVRDVRWATDPASVPQMSVPPTQTSELAFDENGLPVWKGAPSTT